MKFAKKILCTALVLVMALSLAAIPAFADGEGTDASTTTTTTTTKSNLTPITTLPVYETITGGENENGGYSKLEVTVPNLTITVTLTAITADSEKDSFMSGYTDANQGIMPNDTPSYTNTYSFPASSSDDGYVSDCSIVKNFDLSNILTAIEASANEAGTSGAGEYWYCLTTTPQSSDSETLTFLDVNYRTARNYLVKLVTVVNPTTKNLIINQVMVLDSTGKVYNTEWTDPKFEIKNPTIYAPLIIKNHVYGEGASAQTFTYYLNIPVGGDNIELTQDNTFKAKIYRAKTDTYEDFTVIVNGNKANILSDKNNMFTLASGDYLEVDVPNGMIFGVIQESKENYATKHEYYSTGLEQSNGGWETTVHSQTIAKTNEDDSFTINTEEWNSSIGCTSVSNLTNLMEGLSTTSGNSTTSYYLHKGTISSAKNTVYYHNIWNYSPLTGIVLEVAPYVMIVTAALALGLMMMLKKKKTDR